MKAVRLSMRHFEKVLYTNSKKKKNVISAMTHWDTNYAAIVFEYE
jgi:hypothetical protein